MMMSPITERQARALAALVAELRTDWDAQGIFAAIGRAKDRGTATDVAIAAIRAAGTPTNRTPAIIALAGDHWAQAHEHRPPMTVPGPSTPRCTVEGHEHELATACRICAVERLEPTGLPTLTIDPAQAELNARGAALVRAALTNPTPRTPDVRERAAGNREDD